jgi:DNA-binding beta-propeller fold protein YncE
MISTTSRDSVLNRPKRRRSLRLALAGAVGVLFACSWAWALQVSGLESPHSFLADPASRSYFISNINGETNARDNNGFITKLSDDGKITAFKFIEGGRGDVTLHAPKGMAVVDQVLYVTDLDALRAFDKTTGKPLATLALPRPADGKTAQSLVDVAADGQGHLYLADQAGNAIYRVDLTPTLTLSLYVSGTHLAGPSGVAVHPKTGHIVVVSYDSGKIFDITPEGTLTELASNGFFTGRFQNLSGVDFDRWGSMYVSDATKGKIWRMLPNNKFQVIAEYLPGPSDLGIDRVNHLILVPYQDSNAAEVNGLESPTASSGDRAKRTLADYGFVEPLKAEKEGSSRK